MKEKTLRKLIRSIILEYGDVTVTRGPRSSGRSSGGGGFIDSIVGFFADADESNCDEEVLDEDETEERD